MSAVSRIHSLDRSYSMESFYKQIGRSRQAYLQQCVRDKAKNRLEEQLISLVKQLREDHPRMGSRTMYKTLRELGFWVPIGITNFERLLSRMNLIVGTAKSRSPRTSDGLGKRDHPNLINDLTISNIN